MSSLSMATGILAPEGLRMVCILASHGHQTALYLNQAGSCAERIGIQTPQIQTVPPLQLQLRLIVLRIALLAGWLTAIRNAPSVTHQTPLCHRRILG